MMTWTFTNTTAWATAQDNVMAKDKPTLSDAWSLNQFRLLCEAQELVGPTNLTIRQRVIQAALTLNGELDKAWQDFRLLCRNGLYIEGPSYFLYVKAAFDFYHRITGKLPIQYESALSAMEVNYLQLSGPDGKIPLAETRETGFPTVEHDDGEFSWDSHTVVRRNGSFLLVEHEAAVNEFPYDFHVNPSFGHFAFYKKGRGWLAVCPPYIGYANKQKRPNAEAAYLNVPRGPWNDSYWRVTGGQFEVIEATPTLIHLKYGRKWFFGLFGKTCERIIEIDHLGFTVTDIGGGITNLLGRFGSDIDDKSGVWDFSSYLGSLNEKPYTEWIGKGTKRSVRFEF